MSEQDRVRVARSVHIADFSRSRPAPTAPPDLARVRAAVAGKSLTFFFPAYREAASLPRVIPETHEFLSTLGLSELRLVIVDDGSTDSTGMLADALAEKVPGLRVVHHSVNKGYGGAVISGIRCAVDDDCDYWGFCDADGQFAPESVGALLCVFAESGADLAVGRRVGRQAADSAFREMLGRLWGLAGRMTLGSRLLAVDDVDCGLKVGRTRAVAEIAADLGCQTAAISPELLARSALAGHRIVQCDVPHLPRLGGTSTGSNIRVAWRSAVQLVRLALVLRLRTHGHAHRQPGLRVSSLPAPRSRTWSAEVTGEFRPADIRTTRPEPPRPRRSQEVP